MKYLGKNKGSIFLGILAVMIAIGILTALTLPLYLSREMNHTIAEKRLIGEKLSEVEAKRYLNWTDIIDELVIDKKAEREKIKLREEKKKKEKEKRQKEIEELMK